MLLSEFSQMPKQSRIPEDCLKEYIQFYKTARKDHRALHWSREIMIWTLHSFYCRSSGMVPLNVAELDIFWTTGNIPTRNLHRLQPQTFISHAKECYNRCGLCSTSFQNNELIYQLPCGDRFHITHDAICRTDNLKIILRNNNQCPSCCDRVVLCETER